MAAAGGGRREAEVRHLGARRGTQRSRALRVAHHRLPARGHRRRDRQVQRRAPDRHRRHAVLVADGVEARRTSRCRRADEAGASVTVKSPGAGTDVASSASANSSVTVAPSADTAAVGVGGGRGRRRRPRPSCRCRRPTTGSPRRPPPAPAPRTPCSPSGPRAPPRSTTPGPAGRSPRPPRSSPTGSTGPYSPRSSAGRSPSPPREPASDGALQVTVRLVADAGVTVGAPGADGGSATFTRIVNWWLAETCRPMPSPSPRSSTSPRSSASRPKPP